jgi:hypothetical protein
MGSFDANGADINIPKSAGKVTDSTTNPAKSTGEDHPFADTLHAMSSRPDKHRVAQAADAADSPEGKSEKQFVEKAAHDIRRQLKLDKDASSEDVFKKMGVDGYEYYRTHPNEQANALKESGLTKENISAESLTQSIIARNRAEEHLPNAKLDKVEEGIYKKLYKDLKNHTERIDYD